MSRSTIDLLPIKPGFPWNATLIAKNPDPDADPLFPPGATYRMGFKQGNSGGPVGEQVFEIDTDAGLTVVADPDSLEIELTGALTANFTSGELVYCDLVRTDGAAESHTWIELVLSVSRSVTDV